MQNYDFKFSLFSVVSLRKIILSSGTLIGLFEPQEVRGKKIPYNWFVAACELLYEKGSRVVVVKGNHSYK